MKRIDPEQLFIIANSISGVECRNHCRKWPRPLMRYMVLEQLTRQGDSISRASTKVGISHCTGMHGLKMLKELKTVKGWFDEKQLYSQFKKEVERQLV